jgi:small subunit ribosomal protein S6
MYIIAAALDDEAKDVVMETVESIIADGGEVVKTDRVGLKKLAYPIRKKNEGYYVLVEFKAPADLPKELDRRLRISDDVVRHLIINLDDNKNVSKEDVA